MAATASSRSRFSPGHAPWYCWVTAVVVALLVAFAPAQVPQIINYQGRVAVGTTNFNGSGQFKFALVNGIGTSSYWSNDGTSVEGSPPSAAVTLTVTKGLYSVLLGDATIPNMTAVPATVFSNSDVRLRVWFNDGSHGWQLLAPDQRIAAVGYALVARTLQSGATLSASTATPAASVYNTTDNPAALSFDTAYRNWWVGQNQAPDATSVLDNFFIYDQTANATRLRIDTGGVIHGNGAGLTGISGSNLASNLTLGGTTTGTFSGNGSGLTGVTATSVATPTGMVLIPAGAFTMGDSLDGLVDAVPVSATLSAFYIGVNEVTLSQWQAVYFWATSHGYTLDHVGSGKSADHPVQTVNWYDCVKWCNARSEMENLTPCYTVSGAIYRTGTSDDVTCNWNANGYRLPSEAEWEKAARGGLTGQRFPWGNTITQNLANYYGNITYSYDLGPDGYNPIGNVGGSTYTTPVGTFAANSHGLNDIIGNVFEWCWDWYGTPYAGGSDPHGPAGSYRVIRGGGWDAYPGYCRVAYRDFYFPPRIYPYIGFRLARSLVF